MDTQRPVFALPSYERPLVADLQRRLTDGSDLIVAVFGPRQSGKTTAILQVRDSCWDDGIYHAADTPRPGDDGPRSTDERWLIARWEEARAKARRSGKWELLIIDEIQKIADWSATVKGLWDEDRRRGDRVRIVILGSAPMLMQHGLTESLAGRFRDFPVSHWSFGEMFDGFGFDLDEFLHYGGYPRASEYRGRPADWLHYVDRNIVRPTVERDVLAMMRVDKPALLKRLLRVGSQLSAQVVSFNQLVGDLQDAGNVTTLAHYLDLLEQVGLLAGLPNFARQPQRRRADPPKLLALNPALVTAATKPVFETTRHDRSFRGRLVETAVGAHLYLTKSPLMELHHWREHRRRKDSPEVDFVMTHGERTYAIEVKSGSRRRYYSGLDAFRERFPEAVPIVVGGPGGEPLSDVLSRPASEWIEAR